jgi:hypothetical protein
MVFFQLAQLGAKRFVASKATTRVAVVRSHLCDPPARRVNQRAATRSGLLTSKAICGLLLLALISPSASARDLFVNNRTGDDASEGYDAHGQGSLTGPMRTIGAALAEARPGDRIVLANTGEAYRESITLFGSQHSGNRRNPFVIQGNGAVLDGTGMIPGHVWEHRGGGVYRFRPRRLGFQQLFLGQQPLVQRAVKSPMAPIPPLDAMQWCLRGGYLYFRPGGEQMIDELPLACAAESVGITLYHVRNVVLVDLVIQGYQLDGVNAHDSATQVVLSGLTCRGNGRSGVAVCGVSQVELDRCLLGNNGTAQLLAQGYSTTQLVETQLLDNTAPKVLVRGEANVYGNADWVPQPAAAPEASGEAAAGEADAGAAADGGAADGNAADGNAFPAEEAEPRAF